MENTAAKPTMPTRTASVVLLRRLLLLRIIVLLFAVGGYSIAGLVLNHWPPLLPIVQITILALLSIVLTYSRLRRSWAINDIEIAGQLLFDMGLVVYGAFYYGGAANPVISYLQVIIAIAAAVLHWRLSVLITSAAIIAYSLMLFFAIQQPQHSMHSSSDFSIHLIGMWGIFVGSALLMTVFISRFAQYLRNRDQELYRARELLLRNEQLVAIGTLAASTAHALSTPLNSVWILLQDLLKQMPDDRDSEFADDLSLLQQQLAQCRRAIEQLRSHTWRTESNTNLPVATVMDRLKEYIALIHPTAAINVYMDSTVRSEILNAEPSLFYALVNMLENAIDAAHSQVELRVSMDTQYIQFDLCDDGDGVSERLLQTLGQPWVSTKADGLGLGFFLANSTIERVGGTVSVQPHAPTGTLTRIQLPRVLQQVAT